MKLKFLSLLCCLLFIEIIINGCSLKNTNTVQPAAGLLFAAASPNCPNVDIYLNSSLFVQNVAYGDYTNYALFAPGSYEIFITPNGATNTVLINSTVTLLPNTYYSFITIDSVSKIQSIFLTDSLFTPPSGSIAVRFLNLSPNSPAIDFALPDSGSVLSANRTFNDQTLNPSYTKFTPFAISSDSLNLDIRLAGTNTAIDSLRNQIVLPGNTYTFYLKGFYGNTGTQKLAIANMQNSK